MVIAEKCVAIVGTGYVADLYMRSLELHPEIKALGAFDIRPDRLQQFCDHWGVPRFDSIETLLDALPDHGVVLNLTNPASHFSVSRACLEHGRHVYSEKPLAMRVDQARELVDLAETRGLFLAGAPCSYLSETAQTLAAAVRAGVAGPVRLVYAELDDGFIPQAPYKLWTSESGAQWPFEDEFRSGCTVEHAGYYLTWLISMFGSVSSVTAASASTIDKGLQPPCDTPDVSVGVLFFESGPVVRITCSIVAPHDHRIRVIGDAGVLEVAEAWNNQAPVRFRKRFVLRRRLLESPLPRRVRLASRPGAGGLRRRGAARMDFCLGVVELLNAIQGGAPNRVPSDLALHVTEVTLALQEAGSDTGARVMTTRCDPISPMEWAQGLR